jgi:hypothetical protein
MVHMHAWGYCFIREKEIKGKPIATYTKPHALLTNYTKAEDPSNSRTTSLANSMPIYNIYSCNNYQLILISNDIYIYIYIYIYISFEMSMSIYI